MENSAPAHSGAVTAGNSAGREPVFVATSVSKTYPGVAALSGFDLTGYPGEVIAICGANGAGKSTFSRLLSGQEEPTSGTIRVAGFEGAIASPADAERAGVLLMHQEPLVVDDFTVGENVWLYSLREGRDVKGLSIFRNTDDAETREALGRVGLASVPTDTLAESLGPGQRQMLALSRAVVVPHKILILDETTASTTEAYFENVVHMVEAEKAAGTCVLFVSHRMQEVFALADRVAVLRNGQLVGIRDAKTTTEEEITQLMIGDAIKAMHRPPDSVARDAAPLLEVDDLRAGPARAVSFSVQPGEIVGIYGLVGSGRSSVARSITGQRVAQGGTMLLNGKAARLKSPGEALRHGIAYITEDRRKEGFVPDFSNRENLSLVTISRLAKGGVIQRQTERRRSDELVAQFQVKGTSDTMTSTLSGGNQQKVCVAKWLAADPDVVVLDEPTKGVDIGARANIYEIVYGLASAGRGVVVVSSEAEEILLLCHRVLVMRNGAVVSELDAGTSSSEDLIRDALGA